MNALLGKLGDRVLGKLVPKATAQADTSYYMTCFCYGTARYQKLCHIVGGQTGCVSGCERRGNC